MNIKAIFLSVVLLFSLPIGAKAAPGDIAEANWGCFTEGSILDIVHAGKWSVEMARSALRAFLQSGECIIIPHMELELGKLVKAANTTDGIIEVWEVFGRTNSLFIAVKKIERFEELSV